MLNSDSQMHLDCTDTHRCLHRFRSMTMTPASVEEVEVIATFFHLLKTSKNNTVRVHFLQKAQVQCNGQLHVCWKSWHPWIILFVEKPLRNHPCIACFSIMRCCYGLWRWRRELRWVTTAAQPELKVGCGILWHPVNSWYPTILGVVILYPILSSSHLDSGQIFTRVVAGSPQDKPWVLISLFPHRWVPLLVEAHPHTSAKVDCCVVLQPQSQGHHCLCLQIVVVLRQVCNGHHIAQTSPNKRVMQSI